MAPNALSHIRRRLAAASREERGNLLIESVGMVVILAIATVAMASLFAGVNSAAVRSHNESVLTSHLSSALSAMKSDRSAWPGEGEQREIELPRERTAIAWTSTEPAARAAAIKDVQPLPQDKLPEGVSTRYLNVTSSYDGKTTCTPATARQKECMTVSQQVIESLGGVSYRTLHEGTSPRVDRDGVEWTFDRIAIPSEVGSANYVVGIDPAGDAYRGCHLMASLERKLPNGTYDEVDWAEQPIDRAIEHAEGRVWGQAMVSGSIDIADTATTETRYLSIQVRDCAAVEDRDPAPAGSAQILVYTAPEQKA